MERVYHSLGARSLDHDLPPLRLWHKAKKYGVWNPADLDFGADVEQWQELTDLEREVILNLTAQFQAGEESVTLDLLPLIMVIASEGRLEEEMFLTSFLFEEAKHVEAFSRFLDEVVGEHEDLTRFHTPSYQLVFARELPEAMERLKVDASPEAQVRASVTYNMIVEGVLAETAYHAFHVMLTENALLPGMQQLIAHLKRDESRHIAYGVYLISRLVAEHGDPIWRAAEARMNELLPIGLSIIQELFDAYPELPFGLEIDTFIDYALDQFQRRFSRIERARSQTLAEVMKTANDASEAVSPVGI